MHIESIEVENYKCFWKPQKIMLEHGFNLFVGANNSGKTTVLEALDLNPGANEPHRSVLNIPKFGGRAIGDSRIVVRIATDIPELRRLVGGQFYVPLPQNYSPPTGQEEVVAQQIITSADIVLEVGFEGGIESVSYETTLGKSGVYSRNGRSENNIIPFLVR